MARTQKITSTKPQTPKAVKAAAKSPIKVTPEELVEDSEESDYNGP